MADQEQEKKPVTIPVSASFAETARTGRSLFALLQRGAEFVKVPVNFLSANDRARIDAEHPDPFPPRKVNAQGVPYLDTMDKEHRKQCEAAALARLKARVAALLPDDFMGTKISSEKISLIMGGWHEADIYTIDRQGANPYETREEGVQAQQAKTAPFGATPEGD